MDKRMIPSLKTINIPPKILIVGAGGIGCEVVKSLAIAGYTNITVLDFDTVSLSNLSRQFFYSEKDIGTEKAKALVSNAKRLYPNLSIEGLYMDVLGPDFSLPFVENFDFVFCAVDNIAARRKVNQMCVFSQTLVIDCASSGKFAQSVPVVPYRSGCYDCSPGSEPGGPQITCTIRSTPENYKHCAAWAFHLFTSMFSATDSTNETSDENNSANQSKDVIVVKEDDSPFKVVFVDRIAELRENANMWKHRDPPNIVDINVQPNSEPISRPKDVWSDEESTSVFMYAVDQLRKIKESEPIKVKSFDKDDELHLAFTTAAANLQARAFSIDKRCSMFDAKGLVSVVEPALATTNSAISGVAVIQMERMLRYATSQKTNEQLEIEFKSIKSVWMAHDSNGPSLSPASLDKPNPNCPVCGSELFVVNCDFNDTKIGKIGKDVGASAPSIVKGEKIVYDAEDDDNNVLGKTLAEEGIVDGDILFVTDLDADDDKLITVIVRHASDYDLKKIRSAEKKKVVASESTTSSDEYSDIIEIKCK